jgi:hypothetical protein
VLRLSVVVIRGFLVGSGLLGHLLCRSLLGKATLLFGLLFGVLLLLQGNLSLFLDFPLTGSGINGARSAEWVRLGVRGRQGRRSDIGSLGNGPLGEIEPGTSRGGRSGRSWRRRSLATFTGLVRAIGRTVGLHVAAPVHVFVSSAGNTLGAFRALWTIWTIWTVWTVWTV